MYQTKHYFITQHQIKAPQFQTRQRDRATPERRSSKLAACQPWKNWQFMEQPNNNSNKT